MFENSADHGNEVMVARFVFLFLSRVIFRETSTEMDVKTFNVIVKKQIDNNFPWSLLLSLSYMDHRNDS